jgi:hypothetical protein
VLSATVQLPRPGIERRKRPAGGQWRRRRIETMRKRCCMETMVSFATLPSLDCIHFQAIGNTETIEHDPIVVGHLLLVAQKSRQTPLGAYALDHRVRYLFLEERGVQVLSAYTDRGQLVEAVSSYYPDANVRRLAAISPPQEPPFRV